MKLVFFIVSLYNTLAFIYVASKLLETKLNFKSRKVYIVLSLISIYSFASYLVTQNVLRIILLFQLLNFCFLYLFNSEKNEYNKITFTSIMCWILFLFSEFLTVAIISMFFKSVIDVSKADAINNNLLSCIIITIFIIVGTIKPIKNRIIKIIDHLSRIKSHNILVCLFYTLIILFVTSYIILFDFKQEIKFVLIILSFVEYIYLITLMIVNYKNTEKIQEDLNLLLTITSNYESVINNNRIKSHEDKNQLIMVRNLIGTDDNNARKHLELMIQNDYDDDEKIAIKVADIPNGGLKGLIYYKLLYMKSKDIECHIEVGRKIKKDIFANKSTELLQNYYKIIGVLIDNAIDAVLNQEKKVILMEIYFKEKILVFSVSNVFTENLDLEKFGQTHYSTKGKNHGYGLQLVKTLVKKSPELNNETEIVGNLFIQKASIDLK